MNRFVKRIISILLLCLMLFCMKRAEWNQEKEELHGETETEEMTPEIKEQAEEDTTQAFGKSEDSEEVKEAGNEPEDSSEPIEKEEKTGEEKTEEAFREITPERLDAAEMTADGTTSQYWESDLIFFGREDEFALYGMNAERFSRGLIVRRDESLFLIDEYYFSPSLHYPRFFVADFDGDGQKEAVIILHRITGTGISVEELMLLDDTEYANVSDWQLYCFVPKDYLEQIDAKLNSGIDTERNQVYLSTSEGNNEVFIDLSEEWEFQEGEGKAVLEDRVVIGDFVAFDAENGALTMAFDVGLAAYNYATPLYFEQIPRIEAEICYRNGEFQIGEMAFKETEWGWE